jgi:threonine/homoserine/homoserine lactone efflux protein
MLRKPQVTRILDRITGATLIALGVRLALIGRGGVR